LRNIKLKTMKQKQIKSKKKKKIHSKDNSKQIKFWLQKKTVSSL